MVLEELTCIDNLREIYKLIDNPITGKCLTNSPYQYFENFSTAMFYTAREDPAQRHNEKIIGGIILGFERKPSTCSISGEGKKIQNLSSNRLYDLFGHGTGEKEGYEYFDFMDSGYLNINAGKPRFLLQFGENPNQPGGGTVSTGVCSTFW